MKNMITHTAVVVALTMTSGLYAGAIGERVQETIKRGDLNEDGAVNQKDLELMEAAWSGQARPMVSPKVLDVNRDGKVDVQDIMTLAGIVAGQDQEQEQESGGATEKEPTVEVVDYIRGDVDGDRQVTVADLYQMGQYYSGNRSQFAGHPKAADVNGDGRLNLADLAELARQLSGN